MKRAQKWTAADIPSQEGKTIIVTGASSGIGEAAARELAGSGAHVVVAVRNPGKGERAINRIRAAYPDARLELREVDLADLASIDSFASAFRSAHDRLDLLINNAGVMIPPYSKTADGFEMQIGVNHFGHFALTAHLMDMLRDTDASRVVTVSSGAHKMGRPNLDDLQWERRRYRKWQAYGDSKIANLYFTFELQRRLAEEHAPTIAVAAHPGVAMTELQRHSSFLDWSSRLIAHDVDRAALPTLRAATDPTVRGGEYFGPDGFLEMSGHPVRVQPISRAKDEAVAARLWELSTALTGTDIAARSARSAA